MLFYYFNWLAKLNEVELVCFWYKKYLAILDRTIVNRPQMKFTLMILSLLLITSCSSSIEDFKNRDTQLEAKRFLLKNYKNYEHLFKLAEQKGYIRVQWVEDYDYGEYPTRHAWIKGQPYNVKVDNPDLNEIINFAKSKGIKSLWIDNFEGNWLVRKAFSYRREKSSGSGLFFLGNPQESRVCTHKSPEEQANCSYWVVDNWHLVKM